MNVKGRGEGFVESSRSVTELSKMGGFMEEAEVRGGSNRHSSMPEAVEKDSRAWAKGVQVVPVPYGRKTRKESLSWPCRRRWIMREQLRKPEFGLFVGLYPLILRLTRNSYFFLQIDYYRTPVPRPRNILNPLLVHYVSSTGQGIPSRIRQMTILEEMRRINEFGPSSLRCAVHMSFYVSFTPLYTNE